MAIQTCSLSTRVVPKARVVVAVLVVEIEAVAIAAPGMERWHPSSHSRLYRRRIPKKHYRRQQQAQDFEDEWANSGCMRSDDKDETPVLGTATVLAYISWDRADQCQLSRQCIEAVTIHESENEVAEYLSNPSSGGSFGQYAIPNVAASLDQSRSDVDDRRPY